MPDPDLIRQARRINLRYIPDSRPGIRRARAGRGFKYFDPNGVTVYNTNTLARINALSIPPAWRDVWISPYDEGHLQATGFDKKNRKQYLYHTDWLKLTSEDKFDRLIDFAQTLPSIREKVYADLHTRGLNKDKVLATIVWLLERTFIRIGNEEYAKQNNSYGLTTLRGRHVKVVGQKIKFEFIGKSGVPHFVQINHKAVAKTIKKCIELPGYELFKCVDENGNKRIIDSLDVNNFLQELTGQELSAKEFRTWGATVLAGVNLNNLGQAVDKEELGENISKTVKLVAKHLRNTPKVCEKYYIHPTIVKTYSKKLLVPHFHKNHAKKQKFMSVAEHNVLTLLEKYS